MYTTSITIFKPEVFKCNFVDIKRTDSILQMWARIRPKERLFWHATFHPYKLFILVN